MHFPGEGDLICQGGKGQSCSAEQLLNIIFENRHKGLMIVSPQGTINQINDTLAEALGKKPGQIIGHHLNEVCRHRGLCKIVQVLRSGKPEFSRVDSINGKSVLIDYLPIYNHDKVSGALAKVSFFYTENNQNINSHKGTNKKKNLSMAPGLRQSRN